MASQGMQFCVPIYFLSALWIYYSALFFSIDVLLLAVHLNTKPFLSGFSFLKNFLSFLHMVCLNLLFFLLEICHQFWRIDNFCKLCKCLSSYYLKIFSCLVSTVSFWNMNLDSTLWCLFLLLTFTSFIFSVSMWVIFSALSCTY